MSRRRTRCGFLDLWTAFLSDSCLLVIWGLNPAVLGNLGEDLVYWAQEIVWHSRLWESSCSVVLLGIATILHCSDLCSHVGARSCPVYSILLALFSLMSETGLEAQSTII